MRVLLGAVVTMILLYAAACLALYLMQGSLVWYPQPRSSSAADAALELQLQLPDARINISARPLAGPDALLYFGGNAEDVSASLPGFARSFPRHALYLVHYRGYGGSSGKPSERALVADALAIFDKLHGRHPNITVIGRSVGSGIALQLACARPVARLVLVTPYDSLVELAAQQFPTFPVRWLLSDKFESWRYAPKVTAPTLILAAGNDEIVPPASSERLYRRFAKGVARYQVIPGAGHNTISNDATYMKAMTTF